MRIPPGWIAAGVLFHLTAVTLQAFPNASGGLNRASWADPTVQGEIRAWAARLGTSPAALEERLWSGAKATNALRDAALWPFGPYYTYAGTYQSWKMFVAPHVHPTRLRIDVRRGGSWELVYLEGSAEHRWQRRLLRNDRLRSLTFRTGWPHYARLRADFAAWVAERAAADFPDASEVRVSFVKERTRSAEEVRAGARPDPGARILPTVAPVPR